MTDISFLPESVTGVDSCSKEIVGIDLLEGCLGTEFNLLTVLRGSAGPLLGMAGASGVTATRALALSRTPKKPHTLVDSDPPAADPADEPAPALAAPAPTDHVQAGSTAARRSPHLRRPHPRSGAKEESARAAVANKSYVA